MFSCFSSYDSICIKSFNKKAIRSFSERLLQDVHTLHFFFHKIFYLRLLYYKLSLCLCSFTSFRKIQVPFSSYHMGWCILFNCFLFHGVPFTYFFHSFFLYFFFYLSFFYIFFFFYYLFFSLYSNYFVFYLFFFYFIISFMYRRSGIASLPTTISKFTVLRSPHIDKKSREQFEIRTHKRVFSFYSVYSPFFSYLCYLSYNVFLCQYVHTLTFSYSDDCVV